MPGESGQLTVVIDSLSNCGAIEMLGQFFYQLEGSRKTKNEVFAVTAVIDPDYSVSPERLEFSLGRTPKSRSVVLAAKHMDVLEVIEVSTTKRFFNATLLPTKANGSSVVRVDFLPQLYSPDARPAELIVTTNSVTQPVLTMELSIASAPGGNE